MRISSILATIGLALVMTLALPAQTVRVIFTSGAATIQRPDEAALRPIVKGETVVIGTRIVTGTDGRVVLTPMPGVKSIVTPNTTLVLESASENRTSPTAVTHQAVIDLKEGAVVSDLNKPEGVTYDYSIRTARGLAGARGTTFTVGINSAGIQTIVVAHGSISIAFTDGRAALLSPGQLAITQVGGETQSVNNISELSPADQAIAQNWTETTIAAIATAIEAGIELDPAALQNALDAATSLGITLSPELQILVDRVLALLVLPETNVYTSDEAEVIKEVLVEEEHETVDNPAQVFRAGLSPELQTAFDDLKTDGDFTDAQISALLSQSGFADKLIPTLQLYSTLSANERGLLQALGIVGDGNVAAVGADPDGIINLVTAYGELDLSIIGQTQLLEETNYTNGGPHVLSGASFFFPGTSGHNGTVITNVEFKSTGDLYVGATRVLKMGNVTPPTNPTFDTGAEGRVELRASDLVDLNRVSFSTNISSILIEAATINLANLTFQDGSVVYLKSKDGEANFGSSVYGKVNFIGEVYYGAIEITAGSLPGLQNIHISPLNPPPVLTEN